MVLAAWAPELARLRLHLADAPAAIQRAVVLQAVGVGLVEAAIGTARALDAARPRLALLIGTAGVYPGALKGSSMGHVVVANKLRLVSAAVSAGHAYLPGPSSDCLSTDERLRGELRGSANLPVVDVSCPIGITSQAALARKLAKTTQAQVENLEAFAVGRAAATSGVPFAAALGLSNDVGPGAHAQWRKHGNVAAAGACDLVWAWVQAFLAVTDRPV